MMDTSALGTCSELSDNGAHRHYGIWLDASEPTAGVYSQHDLASWCWEQTEDPDWGITCPNCGADLRRFGQKRCGTCRQFCNWEDGLWEPSTLLLGAWRRKGLRWEPNPRGGWAGIYSPGFSTVQVIRSSVVRYGRMCSPCFPGQVDAELDDPIVPDAEHPQAYFAIPADDLRPAELGE